MSEATTPYVFFREGFFYIIDMPNAMLAKHGEAKCIADNAACNSGTLKVEDALGRTVWQLKEAQ